MRCAGAQASRPTSCGQPCAPSILRIANTRTPAQRSACPGYRLQGQLWLCAPRRIIALPPPRAGDAAPQADASYTSLDIDSGSSGNAENNGASPSNGDGAGGASHGITRSNFRSIIRRGYVGELLFVVIGSLICGGLAQWTKGTSLRRFNPYSFTVTLDQATGVVPGTPLRMKGVPMGSVLAARPALDRVYVEVEVNEAKTIIPRDSRFELTQSGLIPAASIDITPPEGASAEALTALVSTRAAAADAAAAASSSASSSGAGGKDGGAAEGAGTAAAGTAGKRSKRAAPRAVRLAGPKDVAACHLQGVLVCAGDAVRGIQGGSMDELTARGLRGLRQGEEEAAARGEPIVPGRGPLQG